MDFTKQSPTALSVCPGLRGLERGLERILPELRTCAYVEIESFIVENLLTAMEAGLVAPAPIWSNLKTFDPKPFRGVVDIILGGYPCQPFSYAGNRKGTEDPRHLWPYLYRIAETIRPVQCFFENVAGHLTMGYPEVYRGLRDLGYRVESGIYTAAEVGAPHERERLFILAILGNSESFDERNAWLRKGGRKFADRGPSSELAYANGPGFRRDNKGRFQPKIVRAGSEFPNANNEGLEKRKKQPAWEECQAAERSSGGSKLADTLCDSGTKVQAQKRLAIVGPKSVSYGQARRDDFPAGQGHFQFEWEEPRTIESSLVYTVDGYNFTEDLHRAIGNSVVEQTAELAYIDLMRKHGYANLFN